MRLDGIVVDEQGQPVGGAIAWLDDEGHAVTAPDGSFAFADRAPGLYRLHAHAGDRCAEITLVTLRDGRAPVVLTVTPGIAMHVRVVHRGAPVAGARVKLAPLGPIATTDARGEVTVRGVGAQFQLYEIEADGYAPASLSMWLAPDPGGTIERTVELDRGAALGGVVLAPDGAPASGVELLLMGDRWGCDVTTDDRGAWRVAAAVAGKYRIGVSVLGFIVDHDGATARTDVVVRLPAGGHLAGEVRDGDGAPVESSIVVAVRVDKRDLAQRHEVQARGDASGRFELRDLPLGEYDVFAHDVARASPVQRVSVEAGTDVRVHFVVEPTAIAGVVVDDLGNPVAGADVCADAPSVTGDLTDRDGKFYLGALPPGERAITAAWPEPSLGDAAAIERVGAGARDARIVLPRRATIRGRVVLDDAPLPFFGVARGACGGAWMHRPTGVHDSDGRFAVRVSAPAHHAITIAGPGSALHAIDDIAVEPGAEVDLGEIKLARGRRITGRVCDERSTPVAGARVVIGQRSPDGREVDPLPAWFEHAFATVSRADGTFAFDSVTSSPASGRPPPIAASHESLGCSIAVPLPEGGAEIELVLAITGSIEGVVDGGDSFVLVGVRRVDKPADAHMARVEPSGAFAFEHLPPGDYTLEVLGPRSPTPTRVRVTVVANERAQVRLAAPDPAAS